MLRGRSYVSLAIAVCLLICGSQFNAYRFGSIDLTVTHNANVAAAADSSLQGTAEWVKSAGYAVLFVAMLVEGPIITAAAAFGAALGYFNIWIVLALAFLGDFVADIVYYAIGYYSRASFVEKFGHRFGLSRERIKKLEKLLHAHPTKTLLFIKLAPVLPTPGLMIVGFVRMPMRKYITLSSLIILPKIALFAVVGYYFGSAYDSLARYAQAGEYFIIVAIAAVIAVWWLYQKGSTAISMRLQTV